MENLGGNVCLIMTICDMESLCLILLAKIHDLVLGHPKKMLQSFVARRMLPFSVAGVSSTLAACVNSFTPRSSILVERNLRDHLTISSGAKKWEETIFFSEIDRSFNWIFEKILWETSGLRSY